MLLLDYLEEINNTDKIVETKILNSHEYFGYENKFTFQADLELMIETIYPNVKLVNKSGQTRLEQGEFRSGLMNLYSSKCVISSNSNPDELEAAHIVGVGDGGDYNLSNGLILEANLHKTFDKFQWAINPVTMMIEISNPKGSINKYEGKKINLELNPLLYSNLKSRYDKFIELK
jgi:predicted restriction endonuclease